MYTHIRLINHSLNYMKYMRGETCYKEHPEKIAEIDIPSSTGICYTLNRYLEMRLDCKCGNPSLMGSTIQVTLSPIKEDTNDYSGDDWKRLWLTFLEEMDKIDTVSIKNGQGQMVERKVEKTRFIESNQLVCLHMEAKSGIPHIHGAICPVDKKGCRYGLDYLIERARVAAQQVSQRLGLTEYSNGSVNNLSSAYHTCLDVILGMTQAWSWQQFKKGVEDHGYKILEKKDHYGKIYSWSMKKGDKTFCERDMGDIFRHENLYHLWHELIEPYNNPLELLSSEEILEEIRLRGWYDRFLRGEIQNQMEAALYDLLQQKLVLEYEQMEQIDYQESICSEDEYLNGLDEDEGLNYAEDENVIEELSAERKRLKDTFPTDNLSQKVLYKYYDLYDLQAEDNDTNTSDDWDDSYTSHVNGEDYGITSPSSQEIEQVSALSTTSKLINPKKKQSKASGAGLPQQTEHQLSSQDIDQLSDNHPSKDNLLDLKI